MTNPVKSSYLQNAAPEENVFILHMMYYWCFLQITKLCVFLYRNYPTPPRKKLEAEKLIINN